MSQMDRTDRLKAAAGKLGDSVGDILDNDENLAKIGNALKDKAVESAEDLADTFTTAVENTANSIEGIAKTDDIDFEKLQAAAKLGDESVMTYLGTAIGLASTMAGPVGLALRAGGATGLFKILTGEEPEKPPVTPDPADPVPEKPVEDTKGIVGFMKRVQRDGLGGAIMGLLEDSILGPLNQLKQYAGMLGGDMSNTVSGFIDTIKSMLFSFIAPLTGMIGNFLPGLASADTDEAAPENEVTPPPIVPTPPQPERQVAGIGGAAPLTENYNAQAAAVNQQLAMAEGVLSTYGSKLKFAGIHASSPQDLVALMRDPNAQQNLLQLAGTVGQKAPVSKILEQFNALQAQIDSAPAQEEALAQTGPSQTGPVIPGQSPV